MTQSMSRWMLAGAVALIILSIFSGVVLADNSNRSNEIPDNYSPSGTVSRGHVAVSGTAAEIKEGSHIDYPVPHICQLDYEHIGWSSCGPTSITMMLQHYFPNSGIDVPEVYHSGIQAYNYWGPAIGYKDVSFVVADHGSPKEINPEFKDYYHGDNSGMYSGAAAHYLNLIWAGRADARDASIPEVISEIKERPLILNVWYYWVDKDGKEQRGGHYVVLRGYDDKGTAELSDDMFHINDPVNNNPIYWDYKEFSGRRYKGRIITFEPTLNEKERECTIVVDNNHVQLDNIGAKDAGENYIWWEYYGLRDASHHGDWYYPKEDGHWVKWTPNLPVDGVYEVHAIFNDNMIGKDIKYEIYYPDNPKLPIGMKSVKQVNAGWTDEKLGTFYLKKGSYVKINDTPSLSNVDAVRFEYISPASLSLDLIFAIDTTGSMWDDIDNVKASASAIVDDVLSDIPSARIAVVDYRDFPVDPYGGAGDYEFNDVLSFSADKPTIVAAIQGLTLGWGNDWRESVYSALMHSIDSTSLGSWRGSDQAAKVIILMGDAPPHDPEPFTGYTLSSVSLAAYLADPVIIYPIQIGGTVEKFEELANQTGGEAFTAENAGEVVGAILDAIEEIKTKPIAYANGPYLGYVGCPITFDGTGSYDIDGTIVSYEWDLDDDGEFDDATGATPSKTWDGSYSGNIGLKITDNDGNEDVDNATVTVRDPVAIETATGTGTAYFISDAGTIEDLAALSESDLPEENPDADFPHGLFSFNITELSNGETVNVTIDFPQDIPATAEYWKYNASSGEWYQIPIGSNDGDNIIIITLQDGGIGDNDGVENGIISDPGAPGVPTAPPAAPVPSMTPIGMAILIGSLSLIAVGRIRRRFN